MVGKVLRLSGNTRPDLAFAAGVLGRFSDIPQASHWLAARRVIWYTVASVRYGHVVGGGGDAPVLDVYSYSDYAGGEGTRK